MFRKLLVLGSALGGACVPDIGFVPKDELPDATMPLIEVEPREIDFGELTSQQSGRETVTVRNTGFVVLDVASFDVVVPPSFVVELPEFTPVSVEREESFTFDVVFSPEAAGDQEGSITIFSDASNEPEVPVAVRGRGAVPSLEISPDPMRFGERFIPCDSTQNFTLRNVGTEPLRISSISLGGDAVQLELPTDPQGVTLDLNRSVTVPVRFDPQLAAAFTAELVVESNDPSGTARVPITGKGRHALTYSEQFVVPDEVPIDILIAVDQSCSMDAHQAQLTSQFAAFVQVFQNAHVDWKVGVAVEDDGCFRLDDQGNTGWFTASTPNWATRFSSSVSRTAGGTYTEKLLQLTQRSVTAACNAGFRDAGAPLHVIVVSDERDQSTGFGTAGYWQQYVTSLRNYAGVGAPLAIHGVLDVTGATGSDGGPGGYDGAVQATGGVMLNIYDNNWPVAFASIAQAAVADLGTFELGQNSPDAASIRVWLDGTEQLSGWHYDPSRNSIEFDAEPDTGSIIDVSYGVAANCSP